jgi:acyl-[acyl-carrier-protein]-phospholipid O-acyltransferase/long-chain-fatty-acid--[acyl-carrier-protein] ligase
MAHGGFKDILKNGGFHSFLWTQFLGALNDNLYQTLVLLAAVASGGSTGLVLIVYLLPFLLFSGYSGYLADVISKRTVLSASRRSRFWRWAWAPLPSSPGTCR